MRKKKVLLAIFIIGIVCLISSTKIARAETVISENYSPPNNVVWSKDNSPYIIESPIYISKGITFSIEPGVTIVANSSLQDYDAFDVAGNLIFNGSEKDPINFTGFGGINISDGKLEIKNSNISLEKSIKIFDGFANISSSTISGAMGGIVVKSSKVLVINSQILNNTYGVYVLKPDPQGIFLVNDKNHTNDVGGIGNFFSVEDTETKVGTSSLVMISNSSFVGNSEVAIMNEDPSYIEAEGNWWGRSEGPVLDGNNKIVGLVKYSPWLEKDPLIKEEKRCCSNVLFIPGLEGTQLFLNEKMPITGSVTTNQLWEPNRNADVEKLYLDNTGSSLNQSVYSGKPVGKALGVKDIYGNFMSFLNDLKKEGTINEWKDFGYDWRKPIDEVVKGNEKKSTTTESMIEIISNLASSSKTGKVTLIGHSNGGLVIKYLVKTLIDLGKENLIDSVISVAVPYLGTPQAIPALLHGYDQAIIGGIILKESIARNLATNMASAYSLLPSRTYFSKISGPTIAFASTTIKGINDGSYSKELSSFEDQAAFITDSKNIRNNPIASNTSFPIKGNDLLMATADFIHGVVDPFSWPASIAKWSIVGWGKNTSKKVTYSEKTKCSLGGCSNSVSFEVDKTIMGDGTVIAPSASYNSGDVFSLDLNELSKQEKRDIAHGNLLGASSTKAIIKDIITQNTIVDGKQTFVEKISEIPGVTIGEPDYSKEPISLVLSTHSPVDLHVYDSDGNHTGLIAKDNNLAEDVEDDLFTLYDQNIPGSLFERIAEGDGGYSNYIYLPDNDGQKYSVVIKGTDFGDFTYEVERVRGGDHLDKVEYKNIPVTPFSVATTTVLARISEEAPLSILASSSASLNVDLDSDGSPEIIATSTTRIDPAKYIEALKTSIKILFRDNDKNKIFLKRLEKIERSVINEKNRQAYDSLKRVSNYIGHINPKKISETERIKVIKVVNSYLEFFE